MKTFFTSASGAGSGSCQTPFSLLIRIAILVLLAIGFLGQNTLLAQGIKGPCNYSPRPITGNQTPCPGSVITYCIENDHGYTNFVWDIPRAHAGNPPTGWEILSVQGQNCITVRVGHKPGTMKVTVTDPACGNKVATLPVHPTNAFSVAIQGPDTFCPNVSKTYKAILTDTTAIDNGNANGLYTIWANNVHGTLTYSWSVPAGWTINNGQGTAMLQVTPNANPGQISVTVTYTPAPGNGNGVGGFKKKFCNTTASASLNLTLSANCNAGPCVEIDECFEFTYLGYTVELNSNVTFQFKIKTNCQHDLSYAAFGLPNGKTALWPNANYSAAYNYGIENPTNNPFRSIKFEALNANGYKNGVSDVFEFTVSAAVFAQMSSIKVQAKAAGVIGTVEFDVDGCSPCIMPDVTLAGPDSVCSFEFANLPVYTATLNAGGPVTYSWSVPGDWFIMSGEESASIEVVPGFDSGFVTVYVQNSCGTDQASVFTISAECDTAVVLPVNMISFNANRSQGNVLLDWKTAQEKNNDRFVIERSKDGLVFEGIGSVKGNGTTNHQSDYKFADENAYKTLTYYRLKQYDFDGRFEYSKVVTVKGTTLKDPEPVLAFPNPSSGLITIQLPTETSANATIRITTVTGQVVYNGTAADLEKNGYAVDLSRFNSGIYLFHLSDGEDTSSLRITKL